MSIGSPSILSSRASVIRIEIEGTIPLSCLNGKLSRERPWPCVQ